MFVDRGQGLAVVVAKLDFLPQVLGRVRTLDSLHEQKDLPLLLLDRGVAAISQWAGATVAESRDIVLVSAKCLLLLRLRLERTVVLVDYLPDDLVVLHGGGADSSLPCAPPNPVPRTAPQTKVLKRVVVAWAGGVC